MREKIYRIIEPGSMTNRYANLYDLFMIIVILISFMPLLFKAHTPMLRMIDISTALIFSVDYILRWITADYKFKKDSFASFLKYPVTPMAIIDLLSILPGLMEICPALKLCRFTRLIRACRILRFIRIFRYSENMRVIFDVFRKQKAALLLVLFLVVGYVFITAAILFQIEPDTFDNFFEAIYCAVILLTTVGYGDVTAVSFAGKVITVISSLVGIAVFALPAGMITAGYMNELQGKEARVTKEIQKEEARVKEEIREGARVINGKR